MGHSKSGVAITPTKSVTTHQFHKGKDRRTTGARIHHSSDTESFMSSPVDLELAGESTPMHSSQGGASGEAGGSISFLSPLKKLHELNLNSEIHTNQDQDEYDLGDQTVINDTDSEDDENEGVCSGQNILDVSPNYIRNRKRPIESPLSMDMVITPVVADYKLEPSTRNSTSILSSTTTSASHSFKLSFSNSDSTPCPVHPRKKLKFKKVQLQQTPSQTRKTKKRLLNFQNSVKTPLDSTLLLSSKLGFDKNTHLLDSSSATSTSANSNGSGNKMQDDDEEEEEDDDDDVDDDEGYYNDEYDYEYDREYTGDHEFTVEDERLNMNSLLSTPHAPSTLNSSNYSAQSKHNQPNESVPISQSTPANSRPPTPKQGTPLIEEVGEPINGYRFVKPVLKPLHPYYGYQAQKPNITVSLAMKQVYNRNDYLGMSYVSTSNKKYEIMGDLPVSSAGLMDEAGEDVHFADKRINDPYLDENKVKSVDELSDKQAIRRAYFDSFESGVSHQKVPLLSCFKNERLSNEVILDQLNDGSSVLDFYQYIIAGDEKLIDFIKRERLRWHPDKWISKLNNLNDDASILTVLVINALSQTLNSIIESYI